MRFGVIRIPFHLSQYKSLVLIVLVDMIRSDTLNPKPPLSSQEFTIGQVRFLADLGPVHLLRTFRVLGWK